MYDLRDGLEMDLRYALRQLAQFGDLDRGIDAIERALELIGEDRKAELASSEPDTADAMAWAFSAGDEYDVYASCDDLPF